MIGLELFADSLCSFAIIYWDDTTKFSMLLVCLYPSAWICPNKRNINIVCITIMSQPTADPVLWERESSHKTRGWQEIDAMKYHKGNILKLLHGAPKAVV